MDTAQIGVSGPTNLLLFLKNRPALGHEKKKQTGMNRKAQTANGSDIHACCLTRRLQCQSALRIVDSDGSFCSFSRPSSARSEEFRSLVCP